MKWIDLPPMWLGLHLVLVWQLAQFWQMPGVWVAWLGWAFVAVGLSLMLAAVVQMRRHKTTVIPHLKPQALVMTGVFRFSRNPIYLGDALVLAGAALIFRAPQALILVPLFMGIITKRFIEDEEERLRVAFGDPFLDWAARTGRWV